MKINGKIFLISAIIYWVISFAYIISLSSQLLLIQTLYLFFPILTTLAGVYAVKTYGCRANIAGPLLLITLGLASWAMGEIIWYYLKDFLAIDPFPSIADVFYLLAYPLIFLGLVKAIRLEDAKRNLIKGKTLLLSLLIIAVLTVAVAYFGIFLAYSPAASFVENSISIAYGMADLILIVGCIAALIISKMYQGGRFAQFWLVILLGIFFMLVADVLFAIYHDQYARDLKPFTYIDLVFILSYVFFTYGLLDISFSVQELREKIRKSIEE